MTSTDIPKEATKEYMPTLDGLRGFACLVVVLSHIEQMMKLNFIKSVYEFGSMGVLIFFSLSGFLMGRLYLDKKYDYDQMSKYMISRFSRITPAYYIAITIVILLFLVLPQFLYQISILDAIRLYLFAGSVGIFWSIPPEIQFYCFFCFIWFAAEKYRQGKPFWIGMLAVLSVVFIATRSQWPGLLLPSKYHIFFFGVLFACIYKSNIVQKYALTIWSQILIVIAIVAYFLFLLAEKAIYDDLLFAWMVAFSVLCFSKTTPVSNIFKTNIMRFLGNASFSIYLLHNPIMYLINTYWKDDIGLSDAYLSVVLLCAGIAIPCLFHVYCEKPLNVIAKDKGMAVNEWVKAVYMRKFGRAA